MNILFLSQSRNEKMINFLSKKGLVKWKNTKLSISEVKEFDWIISYGYRFIIEKNILESVKNNIINLHISYLPFNRGAHPNYWSIIENTPSGVSIHFIDNGIDTGPILIQKRCPLNEFDTLKTSYEKLKDEIENLFFENFDKIVNGALKGVPQSEAGTFHLSKKLPLNIDWNTKIIKLKKMTDLEIIDEIEKVRSKNNINWMNILRLAFKHAPDDAREIVSKINEDDGKISQLLEKLSKNKK